MENKQLKGAFSYVGKIFSYAVIVLLVLVGLFLAYYLISARIVAVNPSYNPKLRLYTIVSGSMEPSINTYDVVFDVRVDNPESIKVGDVITFKSTSGISNGLIVTHRVIGVKLVNGKYEFITKGDANPTPDSATAKYEDVIGKVHMRIPALGRLQFFLATMTGWLIVVVLPALGVIIYDIIKLVRLMKIKDNTDSVQGDNQPKEENVTPQSTENYLQELKELKNYTGE